MSRVAWVVALLAVPGMASADTLVQGAISAATGYTDNALTAPSNSALTSPKSDFFTDLGPSLSLIADQPRLVATFTALGSLRQYFNETQANNRSVKLLGLLNWEIEKQWRLAWDLTGTFGEQGSFEPTGIVGAIPQGGGTYIQLATGGTLYRDFSPSWRGAESVRLTLFDPLEDTLAQPRTVSIEDDVSAQLSFARDAAALTLGVVVSHFTATTVNPLPTTQNEIVNLQASWLHELSLFWGILGAAGGGFVLADGQVTAAPTGRVALTFHRELTDFEVALAEVLATDSLVGLTNVRTDATVRLAMQVTDTITLRVLAGAAHDEAVASDIAIDSIRFETGANWKLRENFELDLSQAFIYQRSEETTGLVPDLHRNTITLALRAYLPDHRPPSFAYGQQNLRVRQSEEWDQTEAQRQK